MRPSVLIRAQLAQVPGPRVISESFLYLGPYGRPPESSDTLISRYVENLGVGCKLNYYHIIPIEQQILIAMCSDVSAKEDEKDSFLNRPNGGRYLPIGIMSFAPFLFLWREGVIHLNLGK